MKEKLDKLKEKDLSKKIIELAKSCNISPEEAKEEVSRAGRHERIKNYLLSLDYNDLDKYGLPIAYSDDED